MDPLLTWFSVAVPALTAPGTLAFRPPAELPDDPVEALLACGHDLLVWVLRSHGAQVPGLVEEAVAATSAALTAATAGDSALPALWRGYQALLSWRGFTGPVAALAESVFPADWAPPAHRGGQRCAPPPERAGVPSYGPWPLSAPEVTPEQVSAPPSAPISREHYVAALAGLRRVFFPSFAGWCRSVRLAGTDDRLDPDSEVGRQLRYKLLDAWYEANSLSGRRKKGRVNPSWRFLQHDADAALVGSTKWFRSAPPEVQGAAMDRVLLDLPGGRSWLDPATGEPVVGGVAAAVDGGAAAGGGAGDRRVV